MIHADQNGDCLTITLDRVDKANALTADMLEDLAQAVEQSTAKVVILTGKGKVFSAGADLDAARAGLAISPLWERLSGAIARHPGLTIAALNGTVAGGAMGMVLACDLRIAVPTAKFFYPVMKLGFLPQPSDPKRLSQLVGPARTKLILMVGQKIGADQAQSWGLIEEIVAPDALLDRAMALSNDALGAATSHVAAIKTLI
ncbi:MAG: enoyl-CoA hydratase/isomerase family protein [Yoonia sp.]|nr:enoyl-CoA hydratase/isomerase family protein [Yoonia sp.]